MFSFSRFFRSGRLKQSLALLLTASLFLSLSACKDTSESEGNSSSKANSGSNTASGSAVTGDVLVAYPEYDARIERDYMYDVTVVQGDRSANLVCYNHCDSVATSGRTVNGDMYRRFCEFAFSGSEVRVDITVYADFDSYTVMPSAKQFRSTREGNVISVYLDEPDYFMLKLDASDDSILSVFADEPETDVPEKGDKDVLYIEGWYEPEDGDTQLCIYKNNYTVYLAPGSVLNARLKILGDNVTVKGRGMILDPYSDIYRTDTSKAVDLDKRYLLHVTGSLCTIEDIKMIDARDYNLWVQARELEVTNLKILASEMCTDGITQHTGGDNSFKHCFVYVGDNALVLSYGEGNNVFEDITIGTICCAVFPQNNAGNYTIDDLYIFRCDEGVMRNCYNYQSQQRSFSLTLNNVSAVDADHFPFIFYGYNMGTKQKSITFNNLSVPVATGSNQLGQGDGSTVRIENVSGFLETSNYNLTFNGLSVGGKAVTGADQLKIKSTDGNTVTVTGNGSSFGPATPAAVEGTVKPAGKIYIGSRRLDTAARAVQKDKTWYVPADDVCAAVGKSIPKNTTDINGTQYLSLSELVSGGIASSASYDQNAGRINIAPPSGTTGDLLSWLGNKAHSHWSEYVCYDMHMLYLSEYGGNSFRLEKAKANTGISYNLTPQLQQYGKGTYTLTFSAKADTPSDIQIYFKNNTNTFTENRSLTTGWQSFSITFQSAAEASAIQNACLIIRASATNAGVEIRDAKMVFTR